jgi:hypothetical protein
MQPRIGVYMGLPIAQAPDSETAIGDRLIGVADNSAKRPTTPIESTPTKKPRIEKAISKDARIVVTIERPIFFLEARHESSAVATTSTTTTRLPPRNTTWWENWKSVSWM